MPRVFPSQPSAQPAHRHDPVPPEAPYYRFDPNLGNPRDPYTRGDVNHPGAGQPEVPGTFVAYVEGDTIINTMHGARSVGWRAEPGTPCIILGHWSDGTVHLKWPAIAGHYHVDGRFPAWVVAEDRTARMAGGGRILLANDLTERRPFMPENAIAVAVALLVLLLFLALPPIHDTLGALAADLLLHLSHQFSHATAAEGLFVILS